MSDWIRVKVVMDKQFPFTSKDEAAYYFERIKRTMINYSWIMDIIFEDWNMEKKNATD